MNDETLSRSFRALSHPRRAMVFRLIVSDPGIATSLDRLITATGLSASSLVHHLREMERCGLLIRKRKGTEVTHVLTPGPLTAALGMVMRMSEAGRTASRRAA